MSSAEQVQGTSLENQEKACLTYAQNRGIEVLKVYIERGESATASNRTEFLHALDYCKEKQGQISAFIVWKIDRFARNTTDHFAVRAKLIQYGTTLHSVTEPITDDPQGKLMETLLAGFAEFENEVRKQRCTSGLQSRIRGGIYPWMPPIGYKNSKRSTDRRKLEPDTPDEERFYLIQKGLRLYGEGEISIIKLTELSNKWGLRTRTNKPMRKQLWEVMLKNKFYAGVLVDPWSGGEYKGNHVPMITPEEYEKIQGVKNGYSNGATNKRLISNPDFPLRGFVKCTCGVYMTASWTKGRNDHYPYYRCRNRACRHYGRGVSKQLIEQSFYSYLNKITPTEECITSFEQAVVSVWKRKKEAFLQEREQLVKKIQHLENRRSRLVQMRLEGEISKEEFTDMKDYLDNELIVSKGSENSLFLEEKDVELSIHYVTGFARNLSRQWMDMTIEQKQKLQKLVLPDGIAYNKTTGSYETAVLSPIFRIISDFVGTESELVAGAGIEPAISRL